MPREPHETVASEDGEIATTPEERAALDDLFSRQYEKIRALASRLRWSGDSPTLNATALAHEAYLKLLKHPPDLASKSYEEVIGVFANAMRQILVDAARRRNARKRAPPELPGIPTLPTAEDAIAFDAALEELKTENARLARVVECRFILGMTNAETAAALRLSTRTAEREWRDGKAGLDKKIWRKKE
jgi:RNA polymerase sigma factor (TIGR02999 family)